MAAFFSVTAIGQHSASTVDITSPSPLSTFCEALGTPQRQAALDGLRTLTNRLINSPDAAHATRIMAVDDYRALREASIGSGFEINLIDPDALLAGKDIDSSTHGSGVWRFVVMLGGKTVGLVTVARVQGKWQWVEAGASDMAREVMNVVTRYAGLASSPQLRFIRSLQGVADFIEVIPSANADPSSSPLYVQLFSNRPAPDEVGGALTPALNEAQLISDLRASVRRGMRDPRFMH
jgi:hypothetical protein